MTAPTQPGTQSRRATLAKARQSRRPSRLGTAAGVAPEPDYLLDGDAGFTGLLKRVWQRAAASPDLPTALDTLLTLDNHVPPDVQLRALRLAEESALDVLYGVSWRHERSPRPPANHVGDPPAFLGELALATNGRILVRVPSQGPLAGQADLIGGVLRVPWSAQAVAEFQHRLDQATTRSAREVADCRQWLGAVGTPGRHDLLEQLKDAALRTAPFVLYQEDRTYTNFRDRNTITGKTLWPGHPDCALSNLQSLPLPLWSDHDVVLVVCLALLVRSAGFARIEEANGTQLTVDHVAHLLEQTRLRYNQVPGGQPVPPAASTRIAALVDLADALRQRRRGFGKDVQLYREIHGVLMHKIERVAGPVRQLAKQRESAICARLRDRLPITGASLDELAGDLAASPEWLGQPHGEFGTGLESLIYETVSAARTSFEVDFSMSRGLRSLPWLIQALREQDWATITGWDLPEFFCCVVAAPEARQHFAGSATKLADLAWAMSSRMQYNSWHFIAGNLPKVPVVTARDYFVPPTIPDLAYYSDQHHRGHVAARVRFSIRSPQAVDILGRRFNGFVDLRLLRCEHPPFTEQDLLAAHRSSAFIATATGQAAKLAADGVDVKVTSFDSQWHWEKAGPIETGHSCSGERR